MSENVITAAHILVMYEYEAKDLEKKLQSGEAFEELAKDYSLCPSRKNGGSLGAFAKGAMVPDFEKAAFALNVGEISPIVKTRFGFHIIKRLAYV